MRDGLQHNFVNTVYKDDQGFVWLATYGGGLSRYDGYSFKILDVNSSPSLRSNFVQDVCADNFSRLWVVSGGGVDVIDLRRDVNVTNLLYPDDIVDKPTGNTFRVKKDADGRMWFVSDNKVYVVQFDEDGNVVATANKTFSRNFSAMNNVGKDLWIASFENIFSLEYIDGRIVMDRVEVPALSAGGNMVTALFYKDNEVWIGTDGGVYRLNTASNMIKHYISEPSNPTTLTQNRVTDITLAYNNEIIVSTLKGLNVYDPFTDSFERIMHDSDKGVRSISCNFVNCMFFDGHLLWVGTEIKGVDIIVPNDLSIKNYTHSGKPGSLLPNPVNALIEDGTGRLWVGVTEGGLCYKESGSDIFDILTVDNHGLCHNSVSALAIDGNNMLYAGTWGNGISVLDLNKKGCPVVRHITDLPSPFIGSLIYDAKNDCMWVGTVRGLVYMKDDKVFAPIKALGESNGALGAYIDSHERLWMGLSNGLVVIDLNVVRADTAQYTLFRHKLDAPYSNLQPNITVIRESSDGYIYIGTNGYGFYRSKGNLKDGFDSFTTVHGLANNCVTGIEEDNSGMIWISTSCGLSMFDPYAQTFVNFSSNNGLLSDMFYWNASYKSPATGKLYFGSTEGLAEIRRRITTEKEVITQVPVFTSFSILNQDIKPGSEYIDEVISRVDRLDLHESDKSFTLEFSALRYRAPNTVRYQYMLEGFDEEWIEVPHERRVVTYTNLPPDDYHLHVRCSDGYGGWSDSSVMQISVSPFFYKTIWFYMFIVVIIILLFWWIYKLRTRTLNEQKRLLHMLVQQRTEELRHQKVQLEEKTAALERQNVTLTEQNQKITQQKENILEMNNKIQKLTVDKLQFFTNISHELRTPITLISGLVQRAKYLVAGNKEVTDQLLIVERNAKYLLQLVNQIMDFRKVETGNMDYNPTSGHLLPFVNDLVHPFAVYASERNIRVEICSRLRTDFIMFDTDGMNKTLTNLLSNAIKFSPNGGRVVVYLASIMRNGLERLYISVSDNGEGLPESDLEKVFTRFYQSGNHVYVPINGQSGTGIGLYLCKRLVETANGEITAHNNKGKGCSFRIIMPLIAGEEHELTALDLANAEKLDKTNEIEEVPSPQKLNVLVIEDNRDMCLYIKSILSERYNTFEAYNGKEGLVELSQHDIDFIICDIMMPVMDGMEFASKVKANPAYSHIPMLMLTAQMSDEYRTQSYKMGVEAYLHKPFDEQMLLARMEGILESRKNSQQKFLYTFNAEDLNIEQETFDDKLIRRVIDHVHENYSNPDYSIDDILHELGCSKSMLNKKMQSVIGQSPGAFIRNFRLNLAKELIIKNREKRALNISQIAYEVGFNDPKYFTRCFTKQFNVTPSQMLDADTPSAHIDA
jgi:signal transduction histidine kinase/ligand-binding sensor domain-containing protein/CheY-like chemotaxis protein